MDDLTPHCWKHFSFICRRNTILSIGYNQPFKTHPMAYRFGYRFKCIHSELSAITRYEGKVSDLRKLTLVNIRLDKQGVAKLSKPCKICQQMLWAFNMTDIWYTNENGIFERLG